MLPAWVLFALPAVPTDDVADALAALSSPREAARANAAAALSLRLRLEDGPLLESALAAADAEVRARLAGALRGRTDLVPFFVRSLALPLEGLRAGAEACLREIVVAERPSLAAPAFDEAALRRVGSMREGETVAASYGGEPLSRLLEAVNRFGDLPGLVLLDPREAAAPPVVPEALVEGSLLETVVEAARRTNLRWKAYPAAAQPAFILWLGRPPLPSTGADAVVHLVRLYATGEDATRRLAAVALGTLSLPSIERFLFEEAGNAKPAGRAALGGLLALAPRGVSPILIGERGAELGIEGVTGSDPEIRRGAGYALPALLAGSPEARRRALEAYPAANAVSRAILLRAFGLGRLEEAVELLRREAAGDDPLLAATALRALANGGFGAADAALARLAREGAGEEEILAAAGALGRGDAPVEALDAALDLAEDGTSEAILLAMLRQGSAGAARFLRLAGNAADLGPFAEAARRGCELGEGGALADALRAAFADEEDDARLRRYGVVAGISRAAPLPPEVVVGLASWVSDPREETGLIAALALGSSGQKDALKDLHAIVTGGGFGEEARSRAARGLGRFVLSAGPHERIALRREVEERLRGSAASLRNNESAKIRLIFEEASTPRGRALLERDELSVHDPTSGRVRGTGR